MGGATGKLRSERARGVWGYRYHIRRPFLSRPPRERQLGSGLYEGEGKDKKRGFVEGGDGNSSFSIVLSSKEKIYSLPPFQPFVFNIFITSFIMFASETYAVNCFFLFASSCLSDWVTGIRSS